MGFEPTALCLQSTCATVAPHPQTLVFWYLPVRLTNRACAVMESNHPSIMQVGYSHSRCLYGITTHVVFLLLCRIPPNLRCVYEDFCSSNCSSCFTSVRAACHAEKEPRKRAIILIKDTKTTLLSQPSQNASPVNGNQNAVHHPWNALRKPGRPNNAKILISSL